MQAHCCRLRPLRHGWEYDALHFATRRSDQALPNSLPPADSRRLPPRRLAASPSGGFPRMWARTPRSAAQCAGKEAHTAGARELCLPSTGTLRTWTCRRAHCERRASAVSEVRREWRINARLGCATTFHGFHGAGFLSVLYLRPRLYFHAKDNNPTLHSFATQAVAPILSLGGQRLAVFGLAAA